MAILGAGRRNILAQAYRRVLERQVRNDPEGRTYADLVAWGMIKAAIAGNPNAARELGDRVDGKVTEKKAEPEPTKLIVQWREVAGR